MNLARLTAEPRLSAAIHTELDCCWHQGSERGQHTSTDLEGHIALSPASGEEPEGAKATVLECQGGETWRCPPDNGSFWKGEAEDQSPGCMGVSGMWGCMCAHVHGYIGHVGLCVLICRMAGRVGMA